MVLSSLGSGKLLSTLAIDKPLFYVMGTCEILYQIPYLNFALGADLVLENWYGKTVDLPLMALPYSLHGHITSFIAAVDGPLLPSIGGPPSCSPPLDDPVAPPRGILYNATL
ncbi:hypothetical protein GOP47_0017249 [Adiantum capillus-veneris]|uniref:Uncharacterized protein n=1 Tax=Adiantum capillus-veneris TaxID=13818 RepID=A0A9D4ZBF7_ADICA|nr:hypothetical protein GOP47_0017249 [Adiantum capillus-veneris]